MNFKQHSIITIILGFMGLISCSHQTSLPSQLAHTPSIVISIPDSLFVINSVEFKFYEVKPAKFYEPVIEVKDSFNYLEKSMVNVKDENLFAKRQELIIDFANIADGAFAFPLPGARVLSQFGRRNGRPHTGIDLKVNRRDTIVAAFDGVVRMAGWSRGYGNVIVIRHYNGLETVYSHNTKHLVRSGDHISAGTPISISGETGRATTDHLHFEVRINGKPFDPRQIIDFESRTLHNRCLAFIPEAKGNIRIETV